MGLSAIKNKNLMIGAFYTTRDTLQWRLRGGLMSSDIDVPVTSKAGVKLYH